MIQTDTGFREPQLEGCRQFVTEGGVGTCPDVEVTTRDYFTDMDVIQEFLDEWVVAGEEVLLQELYDAYRYHCKATGTKPLSGQKFGERLSEKGIGRQKRGGRIHRLGIRLSKEVPKPYQESELAQ
jgi:phage/plasmid-associated DNA primase